MEAQRVTPMAPANSLLTVQETKLTSARRGSSGSCFFFFLCVSTDLVPSPWLAVFCTTNRSLGAEQPAGRSDISWSAHRGQTHIPSPVLPEAPSESVPTGQPWYYQREAAQHTGHRLPSQQTSAASLARSSEQTPSKSHPDARLATRRVTHSCLMRRGQGPPCPAPISPVCSSGTETARVPRGHQKPAKLARLRTPTAA